MPVSRRPSDATLRIGRASGSSASAGSAGRGWKRSPRPGCAEVAAIADPALPDALDSLDDLLELDLDGIVIATPSALHAEQAIAALERGLAVFCQKPLGRTAAETRAVVEAARRADRLLAVDLSYRHAEAFRAARAAVAGRSASSSAPTSSSTTPTAPTSRGSTTRRSPGGGCVIDLGIHLVDLAVWILDLDPVDVGAGSWGEPVERFATAELDRVRLACSWNLHAGRDAVDRGVVLRHRRRRVGRRTSTARSTTSAASASAGRRARRSSTPPDEWLGPRRRRVGAPARGGRALRRAAADELVRVAEILDRIYAR